MRRMLWGQAGLPPGVRCDSSQFFSAPTRNRTENPLIKSADDRGDYWYPSVTYTHNLREVTACRDPPRTRRPFDELSVLLLLERPLRGQLRDARVEVFFVDDVVALEHARGLPPP